MQNSTRRNFLKKTSVGGALAFAIPQVVSAAFEKERIEKIGLNKGDTILFQGDSITDAGRNREETGYNNSGALGSGYASLAAAEMLYAHPGKELKIYNKGISGNKVFQLADRWQADCIDLKPNVLSILIGVNDFWHKLKHGYDGTLEIYKNDLNALIDRTKKALPGVKLIIGEPFAVTGIKAVDKDWYPAFDDYRQAARDVAKRAGAVLIPYQAVFDEAQKSAPGVYWTHDGVHPSLAGASLMAHAWLKTVG